MFSLSLFVIQVVVYVQVKLCVMKQYRIYVVYSIPHKGSMTAEEPIGSGLEPALYKEGLDLSGGMKCSIWRLHSN